MMKHQLVGHYLPCNRLDKRIYVRSLKKRVLIPPVIFVEILLTIVETVLRKPIGNLRTLGKIWKKRGHPIISAQIVINHIQGSTHVHGVTNWATLHKTVWHILLIIVCNLGFRKEAGRERKKNKRNNKKKGRVKIVAGIMTREQDSDSTLPPEGKEKKRGITTPPKMRTGEDATRIRGGGSPIQPMVIPPEVVCSFCGVATHGHRDCPVLHQYIREQADALAQMRLNEYRQLQGWTSYEFSKPFPPREGPLKRGGPHKEGIVPGHDPSAQKAQKVMGQAKSGILESLYPHVTRGMAPGGGEGPHRLEEGDLLEMNQMKRKMRRTRKKRQMRKLYL